MLPPWMIDKVRRDRREKEEEQPRVYDDPWAEYEKINPDVPEDRTYEPIRIEVF